MSDLSGRENAFEAGFANEQALEFKATMRRNRMFGLWAGEKMGLLGDALEAYAKAVVKSDLELPGDEDVIRKVSEDLKAAQIATSDSEIRTKLSEFLAQARAALMKEG
jgi:hypothetical protein